MKNNSVKLKINTVAIPRDATEWNMVIDEPREVTVLFGGNRKLDFRATLAGERASLKIFGRFFGRGEETEDLTFRIQQEAPRTNCHIEIRSVLTDRATSNFDGLIRMEGDVEGASSMLSYRALLLSDEAKAKPIPKLEILNKNVASAKHEVSVGKISAEELFYLQSRGIPPADAERMLIDGFLRLPLHLSMVRGS